MKSVPGYPYDERLLRASRLYKRSRQLYVRGGGKFVPTLVSSQRTLSSAILIENVIEYTPLDRELHWRLTDPIERRNPKAVLALKPFASSLFHEQNHRVLWKLLPPAPKKGRGELRRYLNFAESLVIVTDMALGDELGPQTAGPLKELGIVYDPGTDVVKACKTKRVYRNYLQACMEATYLRLEHYEPKLVEQAVTTHHSNLAAPLLKRALKRAAQLNTGFVVETNLLWQERHHKAAAAALSRKAGEPLVLADDPSENFKQYRWAEQWFDTIGL